MLTKKTTTETEYENKSGSWKLKLKLTEKEEIDSEIHRPCPGRSGKFLIQGPNSCIPHPQRGFPIGRRDFPKCRYSTTPGFSAFKKQASGRVEIFTNGFSNKGLA